MICPDVSAAEVGRDSTTRKHRWMTGPVQPILEGHGLVRTYRLGASRVRALVGVDIEIHRGDFVVLQGPSGSGKTTLINLLGFLDRPDAGVLYHAK